MEIKIDKMKIRNFMGIKEMDLNFDGKDVTIYGENGTGKTTIKTAFSWLLFDKNTFGDTKFGIKPVDESGNTVHNLETSVEVDFFINGEKANYKRTMTEKWTRKRGEATATFSGNENSYYIDGIPTKKTDYTTAVSELISEEVFKTITDPLYFNEQIDWKSRRKILMEICGDISDLEVIQNDPDLYPLLEIIQTKTVEQHAEICKAAMKKINAELGIIPAKIDEAERAIPQTVEANTDQLPELTKKADELRAKKAEIINGAELVNLKAERRDLQSQLSTMKPFELEANENNRIAEIDNEVNKTFELIKKTNAEIDSGRMLIERYEQAKSELYKQYDEIAKTEFTPEMCPICHREFPLETVEEQRLNFNVNRAEKLEAIEDRINATIDEMERVEETLKVDEKTVGESNKKIDSLNSELDEISKNIELKKQEHESIQARIADDLKHRIAKIDEQIANYDRTISDGVKKVDEELLAVTAQIDEINKAVAANVYASNQKQRIRELVEEQANLSNEYLKNEKEVYICEQFTKKKVAMLNEKINSHFKFARFKLFDIQVNGGLAETCETTYLGVPYKDLNNAARIAVGIDIINTMCKVKNTFASIFLDNAESIINIPPTESQMIKLTVSEGAKELLVKIGE